MPKIVSDLKVRLEHEMGSGYHVTWNTKKKKNKKNLAHWTPVFYFMKVGGGILLTGLSLESCNLATIPEEHQSYWKWE